MQSKNQNALIDNMGIKHYILNPCENGFEKFFDLVNDIFKRVMKIGENLIRCFKNGDFYLEQETRICPSCNSHNVVKNGTNSRTLTFKYLGKIKTRIQKYYCKDCGIHYVVDLFSIVMPYK